MYSTNVGHAFVPLLFSPQNGGTSSRPKGQRLPAAMRRDPRNKRCWRLLSVLMLLKGGGVVLEIPVALSPKFLFS